MNGDELHRHLETLLTRSRQLREEANKVEAEIERVTRLIIQTEAPPRTAVDILLGRLERSRA
jgi:hypothetical protein